METNAESGQQRQRLRGKRQLVESGDRVGPGGSCRRAMGWEADGQHLEGHLGWRESDLAVCCPSPRSAAGCAALSGRRTGGEAGSPGGGYPLRTLQSERKGQQSREKALACVPGEPVQGWRPRPPQRFPRGPSNGDSFSVVCVSGHQTVFRVLIVTATVWDFPIKIDRTLTSKRDSDIKETSKGPSQSN